MAGVFTRNKTVNAPGLLSLCLCLRRWQHLLRLPQLDRPVRGDREHHTAGLVNVEPADNVLQVEELGVGLFPE